MILDLSKLQTGQRVRYRHSRLDDPDHGEPIWSEWSEGTLTVFRRASDLPVQIRARSQEWRKGQIIVLAIDELMDSKGWAEYSESDYFPEHNGWLVEDYRLEFEPLEGPKEKDLTTVADESIFNA